MRKSDPKGDKQVGMQGLVVMASAENETVDRYDDALEKMRILFGEFLSEMMMISEDSDKRMG